MKLKAPAAEKENIKTANKRRLKSILNKKLENF